MAETHETEICYGSQVCSKSPVGHPSHVHAVGQVVVVVVVLVRVDHRLVQAGQVHGVVVHAAAVQRLQRQEREKEKYKLELPVVA